MCWRWKCRGTSSDQHHRTHHRHLATQRKYRKLECVAMPSLMVGRRSSTDGKILTKCENLDYHDNWGQIWMTLLADPENPQFGTRTWDLSSIYRPTYSHFCVLIAKFSLPWQQGSTWSKCEWQHLIGRPRQPSACLTNFGFISITIRVIAYFVFKYPNFRDTRTHTQNRWLKREKK